MGQPYSLDDIGAFIRTHLGERAESLSGDTDLFVEFGLEGEDCEQFIRQFGTAFQVDLSTYLWYFHHGEEPHAGAFFQFLSPPPNQCVTQIAISPNVLFASANAGKWILDYPPHSLPKRRYDVIAAWLAISAVGIALLIRWLA